MLWLEMLKLIEFSAWFIIVDILIIHARIGVKSSEILFAYNNKMFKCIWFLLMTYCPQRQTHTTRLMRNLSNSWPTSFSRAPYFTHVCPLPSVDGGDTSGHHDVRLEAVDATSRRPSDVKGDEADGHDDVLTELPVRVHTKSSTVLFILSPIVLTFVWLHSFYHNILFRPFIICLS